MSITSIGKLARERRYLRRISCVKDLVPIEAKQKSPRSRIFFLIIHTATLRKNTLILGCGFLQWFISRRAMPRIFIYRGRCIFICRARGVTYVGIPGKAASWKPNDRSVLEEYARCYSAFLLTEREWHYATPEL